MGSAIEDAAIDARGEGVDVWTLACGTEEKLHQNLQLLYTDKYLEAACVRFEKFYEGVIACRTEHNENPPAPLTNEQKARLRCET